MKTYLTACLLAGASLATSNDFQYLDSQKLNQANFSVEKIYRRQDPNFIQGLYWDTDRQALIESSGWYGEGVTQWLVLDQQASTVYPVQPIVPFKKTEFGEGISKLDSEHFIELTWKEKTVKIIDRDTLQPTEILEMWPSVREGWGITLDPVKRILYVSDGSTKITRVDADTRVEQSQFTVKWPSGRSQPYINELEFINGKIWANIFGSNKLYRIDPYSGIIDYEVDFQLLRDAETQLVKELGQYKGYDHGNNVFNGVAYDPAEEAFYVTGKRWNMMFKVKLD